jgi:hypothetical protein
VRLGGSKGDMGGFWRVDKVLEDSEGLRWILERLGTYDWYKADWVSVRRGAQREVRLSGRMQDATQRKRVPDQLQREQARRLPYLPIHAPLSLVSQPQRDMAQSARRPLGRRSLRCRPW